ncbi:hypothetical protein VOLCADRAFT_90367 [Volvox carteri f. nagariensis]|uniref:peptide-methionine (S)-S-oxide reductase n=1 Tax=Volvox carteri f. nagariensis TaxID=3068 RepID=D8TU67_VOLCA|nr:uncharacterized protein VOLCADRAFT_90367 [Volvox carteri f. nagariensis]EFJ49092.1 hypothetical protein VOLCADRAFT_90367 [Volvox carteri f. nagariensis]|eukprot:XP_002949989.1 hypothetical protein VOLCADRAFT_90367 [Volvox carteri f. nagariensis]
MPGSQSSKGLGLRLAPYWLSVWCCSNFPECSRRSAADRRHRPSQLRHLAPLPTQHQRRAATPPRLTILKPRQGDEKPRPAQLLDHFCQLPYFVLRYFEHVLLKPGKSVMCSYFRGGILSMNNLGYMGLLGTGSALTQPAAASGPSNRAPGAAVEPVASLGHLRWSPHRGLPHLAPVAASTTSHSSGPSDSASSTSRSISKMEVATVGGGCFWCVEACYNMLQGVQSAISGYAAGHVKSPTYKQVCAGTTGHAEVVQITYDSSVLSYKEILQIFFTIHDPTTKDRQGNDVGTQYRSIILTHNDQQAQIAKEVMQQITSEGWWTAPLVTEVEPLDVFYPAEDYHQNYFVQNPGQGYCRAVVGPKVAKFRAKFSSKLKQ